MTQRDRRIFLINELLQERPQYAKMKIPAQEQQQKNLLRALFNIRMPIPAGRAFLEIQDAYLRQETARKGITDLTDLKPVQPGVYLWQGDITTLKCDAIVNAANRQMLGCFYPCHGCIDNAIHTYAGVQLRAACAKIIQKQGHEEQPGRAKITDGFNLPCNYVLHTVGPVVRGRPTRNDRQLLAGCYRSCLALAAQNAIKSIAFCCISTGEFHFPNDQAAQIAVQTVKAYKKQTHSEIEVIFNVFKTDDYNIYRNLLAAN